MNVNQDKATPSRGSPIKYWCPKCNQSFQLAEISQSMQSCSQGDEHQLVPIYVKESNEDEEIRTEADFGEGD